MMDAKQVASLALELERLERKELLDRKERKTSPRKEMDRRREILVALSRLCLIQFREDTEAGLRWRDRSRFQAERELGYETVEAVLNTQSVLVPRAIAINLGYRKNAQAAYVLLQHIIVFDQDRAAGCLGCAPVSEFSEIPKG